MGGSGTMKMQKSGVRWQWNNEDAEEWCQMVVCHPNASAVVFHGTMASVVGTDAHCCHKDKISHGEVGGSIPGISPFCILSLPFCL